MQGVVDMNIERATREDIDELVELRLAYLTEDSGPLGRGVTETITRDLPSYYQRHLGRDLFVYVAKDEGSIVSCAFLLVIEKPMSPAFLTGKTGIVLNVYTRPAFRRQDHAKRLMERLLDDARKMELSVVELKATDDGYPLYLSVGFADDASKYHNMRWNNR